MPTKPEDSSLPPGIKVVRKRLADGSVKAYCYVRDGMFPIVNPRTGERLSPDTPRAILESAMAVAKRPKIHAQAMPTIVDVAAEYRKSPEFRKLGDSTKSRYLRWLDRISDKFGYMTTTDLGQRKVRAEFYAWRDAMADHRAMADQGIDTLCTLLAWAYRRGKVEFNHAHKIEPLRDPLATRREINWTPELEAQLLAKAGTETRHAYLLARYTLLRQADLCRVEHGVNFDGEWIELKPAKTLNKTGVTVYIPVFALPPLAALIAEMPKTGRLLRGRSGAPVGPANLRLRFGFAKEMAGLADADIHFHDIRGTSINDMLDAGATDAEVSSVSGHAVADRGKGGLGAYAKPSRKQSLNAFRKWAAAMANETGKVVTFPGGRK